MKANDQIIPILIKLLTEPASDFYLSKIITGSKNPTVEPFKTSSLNLGSQTIIGETMNFSLENIDIQGFSNIQVVKKGGKPEISVNGNEVTFTAVTPNTEAPPPNIPRELTLTTRIKITPQDTPAFGGNLTIKVKTATIIGKFATSSVDGTTQTAIINFNSLQVNTATNGSNIDIDLQMSSPFTSFIESILKQPVILNQIISGINSTINHSNVLNAISQYATTAARNALGNI